MEKSKKLLLCLLGSIFLALMNSNLFQRAEMGPWVDRGWGFSKYSESFWIIFNDIAFAGVILIIIFSIALIIMNLINIIRGKKYNK